MVIEAPMKPSHVFFGDSLINGVLPKKKPQIYAKMSLMTISDAGRRNLQHKKIRILTKVETQEGTCDLICYNL